ncbi:MAG: hypothetical protein JL50_01015 [Peptococcaceae bacterium BICA1-7]|nr:MAG: hypothetical protein JL50_01015 [Peptococcaceae bacterium BICA1-7]HBV98030.1 hypothetical protein [Desulfotomaculum sp.]
MINDLGCAPGFSFLRGGIFLKEFIKPVLVIALLLLAGCSPLENSSQSALEKEVYPVVETYLENAAAGNWQEVFGVLTGEALISAKANAGQVKADGDKIIFSKYKVSRVGDCLTRVEADITKSTAEGFDRLAYTFALIKSGDSWKIYKTTWGEYLHDDLKPGQLPADAAGGVIKAYLEAPYSEKRAKGYIYLSGKLLQDSERSKSLPVDANTYGVLQQTVTTVKSLECLGISDDYAVVKAVCSVTMDGAEKQASFLIDTILVNGAWKIAGIENL